jgi:hypothetical protein
MKLTKLATEEGRRTKIIEFISSHQGCNLEDIIRGTENYVSRMTVRRILGSLEKVSAIRRQKDKPNSRDHKFFVDKDNPLISLPKEFDKFKKYYYPLLERLKKDIKEYLTYKKERHAGEIAQCFRDLSLLGTIFAEFIRIYDTRALLDWPKQITDTEDLKDLYMLLFSNVLEIRGQISKVFNFLFSDWGTLTEEGIFGNVGMNLLGQDILGSPLIYNIHEHNDFETATNRVIEHITAMRKKAYESYANKAEKLETKMDEQTGNYVSSARKQKRPILRL